MCDRGAIAEIHEPVIDGKTSIHRFDERTCFVSSLFQLVICFEKYPLLRTTDPALFSVCYYAREHEPLSSGHG